MSKSRREDLVDTALELFRKHGYNATGIEKILKTADVSKPTLYRHFDSKNDLIIAALEKWDKESRAWLQSEMESRAETPRNQILGLFEVLSEWFDSVGFQGCMFINATVEFADHDNPIHRMAATHKRRFADYVHGLVQKAGAEDPDEVVERLMILMEGTIVTAHTHGRGVSGERGRAMAEQILDHAIGRTDGDVQGA